MTVTYFGALIAGLLSFLSPCVLPLVPPYLCFLGGATFDQLAGEDETPRHVYVTIVLSSVAFVLGFTTVFVTLGATATALGQLLIANFALLSKIVSVIIILVSLHFLESSTFRFCTGRRVTMPTSAPPGCLAPMSLASLSRSVGRPVSGPCSVPSSLLPRARIR